MLNLIGLKVVEYENLDNESNDEVEGRVGTVVEFCDKDRTKSSHNTVLVQWDCGRRTNYKIGHNEAYDLLVLDSASTGIKHSNRRCDVCRGVLRGTRWHCDVCEDFDLCTSCYMGDKHNLLHPFRRFDSQCTKGNLVAPRATSSSVQSQGLFVGARVSRGHNWEWGEQDVGKYGTIVSISGTTQEHSRSIASVRWADGSRNIYRIGHGGKVDLKCTRMAPGTKYYKDHLAPCAKMIKIRQSSSTQQHTSQEVTSSTDEPCIFKVGDRVKVVLEAEVLKSMLEGHGGWNNKMEQLIGKEGVVSRITTGGDVRVQYERSQCKNISCKWTFHPAALIKLNQESPEASPSSLSFRSRSNSQPSPSEARNSVAETILLESTSPDQELGRKNVGNFIKHISSNNLEGARTILTSHQTEFINEPHNGRIALHIAAYNGYDDLITFLLSHSANVNVKDSVGQSALHHLFIGYRLYLNGDLLLRNETERSNYLQCISTLIESGCDVNCKDSEGNSPLHYAVSCDRSSLALLLNSPKINFKITNNKTWNSFHQAASLGKVGSLEMLNEKCPNLLTSRTGSKSSALHISTTYNKRQVVQYLLEQEVDVNARDDQGTTPLQVACSLFNISIIQDLIGHLDIDVNTQDNQSQTCADVVLNSRLFAKHKLVNLPELHSWNKVKLVLLKRKLLNVDGKCDQALAILCYLAFHGEKVSHFVDVRPREWKDCVINCVQISPTQQDGSASRGPEKCQICDENDNLVTFNPCGHSVVCKACCVQKMRKCFICKEEITSKTYNGKVFSFDERTAYDKIIEMQKKICDLEDKMSCQICMERPNNVALTPCGHQTCLQCSKKCRLCPFCRKSVNNIQNLFF